MLSALDMVLQRQVPARPAAKAGDGFSAGDATDGSRADAFSAALSQEKRNSLGEQDKAQSVKQSDSDSDTDNAINIDSVIDIDIETDIGADLENEAVEAVYLDTARTGQSDEIMNLLSGLRSSAAYSDDAELGNSPVKDDLSNEAEISEQPVVKGEIVADEDLAHSVEETAELTEAVAREPLAASEPNAETLTSAVPVNETTGRPATTDKSVGGEVKPMVAQPVANPAPSVGSVTAPPVTNVKADQAAPEVKSVTAPAQVASAAAGVAAQAVPLQPRSSEPSPRTDPQKDQTAIKEAMRALGVDSEAGPANVDASKTQARGRSAARQGGAEDQRIDDLAGKKEGKIEVIESRRFMPAQNLSANTQMLTRSLAEASSNALAAQRAAPVQALAQTGSPQAGQTLHTLKLQLNPVSLGSVTAVLKLSGEELSVEIKVETAEAYRQIKDDNQSILKALRGQGFGVEQISVQHVIGNDRASGQQAQPGFQSSQQGPGSNDTQSSSRDGDRNSAGQQQSGSRGGQSHEQNSYTGSGAGRTDGVYL